MHIDGSNAVAPTRDEGGGDGEDGDGDLEASLAWTIAQVVTLPTMAIRTPMQSPSIRPLLNVGLLLNC